ncbi:MAG TPA: hypothetical protein VFT31_08980 [Kribbella sp.]|nr:hypothetical protein [Kribbella sp.]
MDHYDFLLFRATIPTTARATSNRPVGSYRYRLERPESARLKAVIDVNRTRLAELARAQEDGVLPKRFAPVELLALIQSIATTRSSMNPEFGDAVPLDRAHRRRTVVEAVRRLSTV